jgi:hypothetical protein
MLLNNSGLLKSKRISSVVTDPNFSDVLTLLRYDGNFNDVKGNTVTTFNSPTIDTTTFKFGSGSSSFNGSNCIQILSSNFVFTGDFTFETWLYLPSLPASGGVIFNTGTSNTFGRVQFGVNSDGTLYIEEFLYGYLLNSTTNAVPINQWVKIAFSRNSGMIRSYIQGVLSGSVFRDSTFGTGEGMTFASLDTSGGFLNCRLDETRITQNIGRYPAEYTVVNQPFTDN